MEQGVAPSFLEHYFDHPVQIVIDLTELDFVAFGHCFVVTVAVAEPEATIAVAVEFDDRKWHP